MKKVIFLFLFLCMVLPAGCSDKTEKEKHGSEIPAIFKDNFIELSNTLSVEELDEFKNKEEEELHQYHFSLGRWVRNNFGLYA